MEESDQSIDEKSLPSDGEEDEIRQQPEDGNDDDLSGADSNTKKPIIAPQISNINKDSVTVQCANLSELSNLKADFNALLLLSNKLPSDQEKEAMMAECDEEVKQTLQKLNELETTIKSMVLHSDKNDDELRKESIDMCERIVNDWDKKVKFHNPSIKKMGKSLDRSFSLALSGVLRNPDSLKKCLQKNQDGTFNNEIYIDLDVLLEKNQESNFPTYNKMHSIKKLKEKVSKGRKLLTTTFDPLVNFISCSPNLELKQNYSTLQQSLFGTDNTNTTNKKRKESLDIEYDEIQII
jgi:hypothetical protein